MKLEFDAVTKRYGDHTVLDAITAQLEFPHVLALLGPSGGGKSTLLRVIGGLESPETGSLTIDGQRVPTGEKPLRTFRSNIGTVFQSWNLFPHLDALANIMLPLTAVHGLAAEAARDRSLELLERLHLTGHGHKRPAELSGGQRQRVAIARAVAIHPRLLLLDEPTSALDPEMTAEVLEVIADLKSEGRTFILVTHAMNFARSIADQVAFLADGRIVEQGSGQAFFSAPQSETAQRFLAKVLKY
ncbi:MAG: amino acid ABC transporter ATP-binding protein [Verrucomicrobia bacterium]|nr:amino acid ABC transporter ATP-binding protein [Verrucomicrobiota bacterium]MDA1204351.1 amino acid ABC transporter ATP-binding protein [Verrucomicrobiota bacterium]